MIQRFRRPYKLDLASEPPSYDLFALQLETMRSPACESLDADQSAVLQIARDTNGGKNPARPTTEIRKKRLSPNSLLEVESGNSGG